MLNKNKMQNLGIEIIETTDDYVGAVKSLYVDVYGDDWAEINWARKVNARVGRRITTEFLTRAFGKLDGYTYTLVITKNRTVAFAHCDNYYMDGSDDEIALLGLIGLYEEFDFKTPCSKTFEMINFKA